MPIGRSGSEAYWSKSFGYDLLDKCLWPSLVNVDFEDKLRMRVFTVTDNMLPRNYALHYIDKIYSDNEWKKGK